MVNASDPSQKASEFIVGKATVCDIENGHLPLKMVIFHSFLYVYQRISGNVSLLEFYIYHIL